MQEEAAKAVPSYTPDTTQQYPRRDRRVSATVLSTRAPEGTFTVDPLPPCSLLEAMKLSLDVCQ